jgi:uncharacterized membrane protein YqjE
MAATGPDPRAVDLSSLLLPASGQPPATETNGAQTADQPLPEIAEPSNGAAQPEGRTGASEPEVQNGSSQPEVENGSSHDRTDLRDEPVKDLLKQAQDEASTLMAGEVKLAKAEMADKGKKIGAGAGMFGAAGLMAGLAAFAFMLCLIFALGTGMQDWLAALIVTVVFLAVAGALALAGKKAIKKAGPPVPEQAIESVKQTIQTVKEDAKWGLNQTR